MNARTRMFHEHLLTGTWMGVSFNSLQYADCDTGPCIILPRFGNNPLGQLPHDLSPELPVEVAVNFSLLCLPAVRARNEEAADVPVLASAPRARRDAAWPQRINRPSSMLPQCAENNVVLVQRGLLSAVSVSMQPVC